jgi:hypothetical protein
MTQRTVPYDYLKYVLEGSGGLFIEASTDYIESIQVPYNPDFYDVTQTLQLKIPTSLLNELLGIYKDENGYIIQENPNYDNINRKFYQDVITIHSSELLRTLENENSIISLGAIDTLYNDFMRKVNNYFGFNGLNDQLINQNIDTDGNGFMSKTEFLSTLKSTNENQEYYLQGDITFSGINASLRSAIKNNIFNNRENMRMYHGFLPGDLLLVMDGIQMKFELTYDNTNNDISDVTSNPNYDPNLSSHPYYKTNTVSTFPKIRNTVKTDILFVLV